MKANLALLLVSVSLALGALELGLRWAGPPGGRPDSGSRGFRRADARMGYDLEPGFPPFISGGEGGRFPRWSNELGCFDRPYRAEETRAPVLLVGDSFAEGSVAFEDNWGTRLEALLGRRLLKCGVSGYGTRQELLKAASVLEKSGAAPSLIVLGYFMNDMEDDFLFPSTRVLRGYALRARSIVDYETGALAEKGEAALDKIARLYESTGEIIECPGGSRWRALRCALAERSALYRRAAPALKGLLRRASGASASRAIPGLMAAEPEPVVYLDPARRPWLKLAWDGHLENLAAFKRLADARRARLLVVLIPNREQVYGFIGEPYRRRGLDLESPNRRLVEFLSRRGIEHLDLAPLLRARADQSPRPRLDPSRDLYLDMHWTAEGNRLAAELTARHISAKRLLSAR